MPELLRIYQNKAGNRPKIQNNAQVNNVTQEKEKIKIDNENDFTQLLNWYPKIASLISHIFDPQVCTNSGYLSSIPFDNKSFSVNSYQNMQLLKAIIQYKDKYINTSIVNAVVDDSNSVNKTGLIPSKRLR